jgi:hypothetical protein
MNPKSNRGSSLYYGSAGHTNSASSQSSMVILSLRRQKTTGFTLNAHLYQRERCFQVHRAKVLARTLRVASKEADIGSLLFE